MTLFRGDGVVPRRSSVKPDGHSMGQEKDWRHWCKKTELGLELSSYSVQFSSVAQLCPTLCLLLVV